MAQQLEEIFLQQLNQHIGIAHKVCRIYFLEMADREDVLQEMMYQLWRAYPGFSGRSKFTTWMYSVCLNTALTYLRKSKKNKIEALSAVHQEIPDHADESKEKAVTMLLDAVASLSPMNKAIVLLYLENISYEEMAVITGITRSNVSVRLVRIKRELETILKQKLKTSDDVNI